MQYNGLIVCVIYNLYVTVYTMRCSVSSTCSRFQPKKVSFFTLFWAHRNTQKLKNQQETF